jgi:DSF synthase
MTPVQAAKLDILLTRKYNYLQLEWREEFSALRMRTRVQPIQCYSLAAMAEMQRVLQDIEDAPGLVKHFVLSSDVAGVFNFGGDLSLFVLLIRSGDIDSLRLYGKRCVDLVWWMENASRLGIYTTVMVQGDVLGGGLESVLPFHHVIFERSAQAGFPEVLFNLFPGMGAWNFTMRKAGCTVANDLILSGKLYNADDLQARNLVDAVADDGQGDMAIDAVLAATTPRLRGVVAALEARRTAAPISYDTLTTIVDQWADTAMQLTTRDLRLMERLARAQARKAGGATEGAVAEIKQIELETAWGEERAKEDAKERARVSDWGVLV